MSSTQRFLSRSAKRRSSYIYKFVQHSNFIPFLTVHIPDVKESSYLIICPIICPINRITVAKNYIIRIHNMKILTLEIL